MKKITFTAVSMSAAVLMISLTACKKEQITPSSSSSKKEKPVTEIEKKPVYSEGIVSHNGFNINGDIITQYYQFWGPSPNSQISGTYSTTTINTSVNGCGGSTGVVIYAYKSSTGVQFLGSTVYGDYPIMDGLGNLFTPTIEEIEIHPQTGIVYALVTESSAKRIYAIDPSTGIYTPITVNGSGTILYGKTGINGYKGGSICFIPDGSGGFELLFSHESNVYASFGVYCWHYSLSGTNLTGLPAKTQNFLSIPGTFGSGINTTYGNGQLYFARHGSSNPLYTLPLGPAGAGTATAVGISVTNTNDFGYWKAF